jgi:uncharacterized OB-fold protein
MLCRKCGSTVPDGSEFCPKCGVKPIPDNSGVEQSPQLEIWAQEARNASNPRSEGRNISTGTNRNERRHSTPRWQENPLVRGVAFFAVAGFVLWGILAGSIVQVPPKNVATETDQVLSPLWQGEKLGYTDLTGHMVISPQFDGGNDFSDGVAAVLVGNPETIGKWGYIDRTGKYVINPQFDEAGDFCGGIAPVKIGRSDGKWGYIDKAGKYLIAPQFADAWPFSQGLASVKIGSKWGYIDQKGLCVISPQFEEAYPFSEDVGGVELGGKWGFIDKTGRYAVTPQFDMAWAGFSGGLAPVRTGGILIGKDGFIDKTGKFVIGPQFDSADGFSEGLAAVRVGDPFTGKWGYIDRSGTIVITPQFSVAHAFSNGLARVVIGDNHGCIDKTGQFVWQAPN